MKIDAASFLKNVSNHVTHVRRDDGLYRHLKFRQPNSGNQWFEIVTWPHSLVIHGDMGTWSFSRIEDMFAFFRQPTLRINESYWAEKIDSESRFGGPSKTFSPDVFKASILTALENYDLEPQTKAEIVEALEGSVFNEEYEHDARRALDGFSCDGFEFSNAWEIGGQDYTFHFRWCLYAIVWAIQQYDAEMQPATPDRQKEREAL